MTYSLKKNNHDYKIKRVAIQEIQKKGDLNSLFCNLINASSLVLASADLLWEKNIFGWCWFSVREKHYYLVGWQAS